MSTAPPSWSGAIYTPEFPGGQKVQVAMVSTPFPASVQAPANSNVTYTFITALATDIGIPLAIHRSVCKRNSCLCPCLLLAGDCDTGSTVLQCAQMRYDNATGLPSGELLSRHVSAWGQVWSHRIEVSGDLTLAQAVNASAYYILSSIRADWPWSLSPGGLGSNSYNGHSTFADPTFSVPFFRSTPLTCL